MRGNIQIILRHGYCAQTKIKRGLACTFPHPICTCTVFVSCRGEQNNCSKLEATQTAGVLWIVSSTKESENAQPYKHLRSSNSCRCAENNLENTQPEETQPKEDASHKFPAATCLSDNLSILGHCNQHRLFPASSKHTNQFLSTCTCTCPSGPPSGGQLRGWSLLCPHPGQTLTGPPLERELKSLLCPETCWFFSPDIPSNWQSRPGSFRDTDSLQHPNAGQNSMQARISCLWYPLERKHKSLLCPETCWLRHLLQLATQVWEKTLILLFFYDAGQNPMWTRISCLWYPLEFPRSPQMSTTNVAKMSLHFTRFCLKRNKGVSEFVCNLLNMTMCWIQERKTLVA